MTFICSVRPYCGGRQDAGCTSGFPECRTREEPGAAGAWAFAACSCGGASTYCVADRRGPAGQGDRTGTGHYCGESSALAEAVPGWWNCGPGEGCPASGQDPGYY